MKLSSMKHNLLNVRQLSDDNKMVLFESSTCPIEDGGTNEILFYGSRRNNVYVVTAKDLDDPKVASLSTIIDQTSLWRRRAKHLHHKLFKHLEAYQLVEGLIKISSMKEPSPYGPCLQRNQTHVSPK